MKKIANFVLCEEPIPRNNREMRRGGSAHAILSLAWEAI